MINFINQKASRLYFQNKKAARLHWTQAWRRNNKKVRVETVQKRAKKRRVRLQKAVGGMTLDEIKKKRDQKPEIRKQQKEAALKELKDKKKKEKEETKKKAKAVKPTKAVQPKIKVSKKGQR